MLQRINDFLDRHILPWPVRFLTFRFVILATIALLIPLIIFADNQTFVLLINSYLNTMSVAVSSIVLLYATMSEIRQKKIADMQEKRAEEDHEHVTEMHKAMLEALANQHQEMQELRQLVAEMRGEKFERSVPVPQIDLRDLHPRGKKRFHPEDRQERLKKAGA